MVTQLSGEVSAGRACLVVTYFEQCHDDVKTALERSELAYSDAMGPDNGASILLSSAELLSKKPNLMDRLRTSNESELTIVFPEHFTAKDYEQQVLEFLYLLRPKARVIFHSSLDEPFMQCFNSDRVSGFIESLNSDPNEAIEHPVISISIVNAQGKIQSRIGEPQPASSQQQWLERNLTM